MEQPAAKAVPAVEHCLPRVKAAPGVACLRKAAAVLRVHQRAAVVLRVHQRAAAALQAVRLPPGELQPEARVQALPAGQRPVRETGARRMEAAGQQARSWPAHAKAAPALTAEQKEAQMAAPMAALPTKTPLGAPPEAVVDAALQGGARACLALQKRDSGPGPALG